MEYAAPAKIDLSRADAKHVIIEGNRGAQKKA